MVSSPRMIGLRIQTRIRIEGKKGAGERWKGMTQEEKMVVVVVLE